MKRILAVVIAAMSLSLTALPAGCSTEQLSTQGAANLILSFANPECLAAAGLR